MLGNGRIVETVIRILAKRQVAIGSGLQLARALVYFEVFSGGTFPRKILAHAVQH
jgi:hypothetical protein